MQTNSEAAPGETPPGPGGHPSSFCSDCSLIWALPACAVSTPGWPPLQDSTGVLLWGLAWSAWPSGPSPPGASAPLLIFPCQAALDSPKHSSRCPAHLHLELPHGQAGPVQRRWTRWSCWRGGATFHCLPHLAPSRSEGLMGGLSQGSPGNNSGQMASRREGWPHLAHRGLPFCGEAAGKSVHSELYYP